MLREPDEPLPGTNALRAFLAAARHESFARAAKGLGLKQSAVSRLVAKLEREIGIRLFARTGRGVRLTPARDVYRRGVERFLEVRTLVALGDRFVGFDPPFSAC